MNKIFKIVFVISFWSNFLLAQDAHLSQNELNLNFNNVATTGMINTDFKLSGIYRSQWSGIPDGFKTYGISFEQKLKTFSYGLDILSNNAGEASLHQNNLRLKIAYNKVLSNQSKLSVGAAFGLIQRRFNPEVFQFDNQYEPGKGFNGTLGNQETFDNTNQLLPDFSAGILYKTNIGKLENELGASMLHLNQPAASFYEDGTISYPLKTFLHLKSKFPVNEKLKVYGTAQYANQVEAKNIILGAGIDYNLKEDNVLNFAIATRLKDAIIISTGLKMKNLDLGLSYDLHRSKLSNFTNGNGAIELSAAFYFNKSNKVVEKPNNEITDVQLKDRDGDQVPDNMDECPDIPGVWKHNGCNDKDQDGIYDSVDACPNLFGHQNNKGCPLDQLKDADMDGLIDEIDECPFLKGLPEHKGCPDSDKDGISDKVDNCPFLKGTPKNNGCPQRSINDNNKFPTDYMPNVHVQFDTDQSVIKSTYFDKLNGVVEHLMNHPTHKIFISGHTDNEGDPAYNFALGERRSNEVLDYFIQHGISITRMSIISYGETKPIGKNNNVYGKARNRRVEVIIIQ